MAQRVVTLTTGDGHALRLPLAALGERGLALAVDAVVLVIAAVLLAFAQTLLDPWMPIALAAFVLRHAYFAGLGFSGHGATPGKRALGLRVIAIGDGPLTLRRLLVRSMVRDVELGLPLLALSGVWIGDGVGLWAVLTAWTAAFVILPRVSPHRQRLADLLAGTAVVRCPPSFSAPLAVVDPRSIATAPASRATAAVLDREKMEVLARLLREVDPATDAGQAVRRRVARELAIRLSRGGDQAAANPDAFLEGVYAELVAYFGREQRMGRSRR